MSAIEWLAHEHGVFMREVFPGQSVEACAIKCATEAAELAENPHDLVEAADVLITLLSWCEASGNPVANLINAARRKVEINKARTWVEQADGTFQHVKDAA